MKLRKLVLAPIVAAAMTFGMPAVADNSLTFQGVTFGIQVLDADSINFSITGATSATGDWTGITHLDAFQLKSFGDVVAGSTATVTPDQFNGTVTSSLSANGCGTGGTAGICFTADPAHLLLTSSMIWQIDFSNVSSINWNLPHLSVLFTTYKDPEGQKPLDYYKTGSLLSATIPIPEPEIYAMLGLGLGLMGFIARRRKQQQDAVI